MKKILLIPIILGLSMLTACSGSPKTLRDNLNNANYEYYSDAGISNSTLSMKLSSENTNISTDIPDKDTRKLIRTVSLTFSISNSDGLADCINSISEKVINMGGYIENNNTSYGDYAEGNISAKIPSDKADDFIENIKGSGMKLKNISDSTEDVTLSYVDIESRLKVKEDTKAKYEEYLKNSANMEDTLAIENELNSIIADIESYKSQLNVLNNQIDYTSIQIYIDCDVSDEARGFIERFKEAMGDFGIEMGDTLIDAFQSFVLALIRLIFVIPIIIIIIKAIKFAIGKSPIRKKNKKNQIIQDKEKSKVNNKIDDEIDNSKDNKIN